jgi:acetyltransferase-like isoleucine patch superfamily enzyme
MVRFIKDIFYKIYLIGKIESDAKAKKNIEKFIADNIILGEGSRVDLEAVIENHQNDKSKIVVGQHSQLKGHLMLFAHGGEILIGDNVFNGPGSKIWSAKKITIGNRVLIAHHVNIHDNISHPLNSADRHKDFLHVFSTSTFQKGVDLREDEVIIEDDSWIGFNSTIMKGVRIGKGAIIGACTLITEDVPPFAVVVGNPARIIKYVN